MHRKTLNIASLCMVTLLLAFVITHKKEVEANPKANIEVDGEVNEGTGISANADEYKQQVMQAILDQNLKSFEDTSDSFKRKPEDTMSDTIAKNVFSQYIEYNTSDSLDMEKIQQETVAAVQAHPAPKSNLTLQNLRISANTVPNLKMYANSVAMTQNALYDMAYKVKDKKDGKNYLQNLYKTTADIYLKTIVPETLSTQHLAIINAYKDYYTAFELMAMQETDPARALTGVQLAKESQDTLFNSFETVKKIVLLNNITFTEEDPAYKWFINASGTEMIKTN